MAQKILAGRCADPMLSGDVVQVKVDQIVLTRSPLRAIADRNTVEIVYQPLEAFAPWAGYAVLTAIVIAAWLAHRVYDEPVRRWLTGRFASPSRRQLWITPPAG